MLAQIDVDGDLPIQLPILGVHPRNSLLVRSVTGLNPADIQLFIGQYSRDGGYYQGRRVDRRNIVITMDINPNPANNETVQGWRDILYRAFIDPQVQGDFVRLIFRDDAGRVTHIAGYTEKFETDLFGQDNQVVISIICPDPYIRSVVSTILTSPAGWLTLNFAYGGTAETGFELEAYIMGPTSSFVVDLNGTTMNFTDYEFTDQHAFYLNTNRGSRAILLADKADVEAQTEPTLAERWQALEDAGKTIPMIGNLDLNSPWLEIHSQQNSMNVYGATQNDGKVTIRTLEYRNSYWGV